MYKQGSSIEEVIKGIPSPVLIMSSLVGKGNYSIGEAIRQKDRDGRVCAHKIIDEFLPQSAVEEDLLRYKFISDHANFLLHLIYRIPFFYFRKLLREELFKNTCLDILKDLIITSGAKTVISISHRPTFWLSVLKQRERLNFNLCGVLSEFGRSLGWEYIFWREVDNFLSPMPSSELTLRLPKHVRYTQISLPCREEFQSLANFSGNRNKVLFIAGYWGQVDFNSAVKIIKQIIKVLSDIHIFVVCGTNHKLAEKLKACFYNIMQIEIHTEIPSIYPLMRECASVITKPGFSTILEAFTAKRKIFLLKGMPVAEDNNARYAISYFDANWFTLKGFTSWYSDQVKK